MFIKVNKKIFKVKKNNLFWDKFSKNKWEPCNFKIYKSLIKRNTNYYDIGSWIGPTVLIAANFLPKEIYAFEPDSKAYKELKNNIFLNKKKLNNVKIEIYNMAAYISNGKIILNIPHGNLGASTSSLIRSAKESYESLVIKSLNFLSFLKIPYLIILLFKTIIERSKSSVSLKQSDITQAHMTENFLSNWKKLLTFLSRSTQLPTNRSNGK